MIWRVYLLFVSAMLFAPTLFAQTQVVPPPPQNSIWFENPIGNAVVGLSGSQNNPNIDLAYAYYFAAIGPKPAKSTKAYGDCLKRSVIEQGDAFRKAMDSYAVVYPDIPTYADDWIAKTEDELRAASNRFRNAATDKCISDGKVEALRQYLQGTRLAVVRRECNAVRCSWMVVPGNGPASAGRSYERAFESTYYWRLKKNLDGGLNQVVLLDFPTAASIGPRIVEVRSDPSIAWPAPIAPEKRMAALEASISYFQRTDGAWRLSPTISAQIELPKKTVLRVANVFAEPGSAYSFGTDAEAIALKSVQDEVARIRLSECATYRGPVSPEQIALCAGYKLDESKLYECLNGGTCMPDFATQIDFGSLLVTTKRNVAELADGAMVPRPFSTAAESFGKMVDDYRTCATDKVDDKFIQACAARLQITPAIATQADCLLSSKSKDFDRLACVIPDGDARNALNRFQACATGNGKNCAIMAALPPELSCAGNAATALAALACLPADRGGEAAAVVQCLAANSNNDLLANARCVAGTKVPPELECIATATSESAAAVCALGKNLPPDQALLLECASKSGGDVLAAGVCVAGPKLNLHPGQQIMLQCAMSSGGEPLTFASCTIGQFTLKELNGCKKADFGQSGCFGDGNEFQKLAIAITGSKISKNSVVGTIAIAHIDAANEAIAGVGTTLSHLGEGAENIQEGVGRELEKLRKNPIETLRDAPGNILSEGVKGVTNVAQEAEKRGREFLEKPFG